MEGLEVKVCWFSESINNKDFRIDSQFYTSAPTKNPVLNYDKIGNLLVKAQYGISISMNEESKGYPIYRMNEIHNMLCDSEVHKFADITKSELEIFELNDRDVLFNRTNSYEWVGRTGLYRKLDERSFVFASYLVRFIPNEKFVLPEFLSTFLNTKYGIADIKRRARQSINQTNVNPEEVKKIDIPLLSINFQNKLKNCYDIAHDNLVKSQHFYTQAENLLLETLSLKNFTPSDEVVNIKTYKESYLLTGRLDAEYYQVKYDEIIKKIKSGSNWNSLEKILIKIDTGEYSTEYYRNNNSKDLTFYIRSTNIKEGQIEVDNNYFVPRKDFIRVAKSGNIVTARVGSIGVFGEVRKELDGAIYSDNVLCFQLPDNFIPSVYTLLFNTKYYYELIDRLARGSVQQRLNQETLKDLIIPIIEESIQQQISEKIEESFQLKKKSEQLLDLAKKAVEMAIEESEEVAMEFINQKIN